MATLAKRRGAPVRRFSRSLRKSSRQEKAAALPWRASPRPARSRLRLRWYFAFRLPRTWPIWSSSTSKDDIAGDRDDGRGRIARHHPCRHFLARSRRIISLGDPAIRLPAMALTTFLAMFSARTFALGPISFLAGFIVVTDAVGHRRCAQPGSRSRELELWLWVVVVVPVVSHRC